MDRVHLSPTLNISRMVYGMWRIGDGPDTSAKHVQAKMEACIEQGITSFDQADIYGDYGAEALLGNALRDKPSLRDDIEIITKCGIIAPIGRYSNKRVKYYDTSRDHIHASVDRSRKEMGIDQIDVLLIHRPDPFMDHVETGQALDEIVASGKVKAVGVSNFKPHDWDLLQSAMDTPLATNQIELSVMEVDAFSNGDLAHLQRNKIKPMAWSPLGGGALFSDAQPPVASILKRLADLHETDIASLAMAWLLAHPAGIVPVAGTNALDRIKRLGQAARIEIDRETWFEIYAAALGRDVA